MNYFRAYELVDRKTYEERGEASIELIDKGILHDLNLLRAWAGKPMTVNNWYLGGKRQCSGFRTQESKYYRPFSQHSFGRAIDAISRHHKPQDFHKEIILNKEKYKNISFIEIDISWLHIDSRINKCGSELVLWSPLRGYVNVDSYKKELEIMW